MDRSVAGISAYWRSCAFLGSKPLLVLECPPVLPMSNNLQSEGRTHDEYLYEEALHDEG